MPAAQRGYFQTDPVRIIVDMLGRGTVHRYVPALQCPRRLASPVLGDVAAPLPAATDQGVFIYAGDWESFVSAVGPSRLEELGYAVAIVRAAKQELPRVSRAKQLSYVFVDEEAQLGRVFVNVWSLLTQMDEHAGGEAGSGLLFELADDVARSLGGATAIEDVDRRVIAYSNVPDQDIDALRRDGILHRRVPDEPAHELQYQTLYETDQCLVFEPETSGEEYPRIALAIRTGSEVLGSIWALTHGTTTFDEATAVLRAAAARAVEPLLKFHDQNLITAQADSLWLRRAVLDDSGDASAEDIRRGFDSHTVAPLMLIAPQRTASRPSLEPVETTFGAARLARRIDPGAVSCSIGRHTLVLLRNSLPQDLAETCRQLNADLRKEFASTFAVVYDTWPWHQVRQGAALNELQQAMAVIRDANVTDSVQRVEQLRSRFFLLSLCDQVRDATPLLPHGVRGLLTSDGPKEVDLRQSALSYFGAFGDISKAADALHVHPNTLRYRLTRIQERFEIDFTDSSSLLTVWLALWADDVYSRDDRDPLP